MEATETEPYSAESATTVTVYLFSVWVKVATKSMSPPTEVAEGLQPEKA